MRALLWTTLLLLPALSGCTDGTDENGPTDQVLIKTDLGDIVIDLAVSESPQTVENFLKYVDDGFFDGTLFHRIIEDFMIQGGGMDTDGKFKDPTHPPVVNEAASSGLLNTKYSISMARTSNPDSATNQFFINHADNTFLDPSGSSAGYTVFGHVVEGHEVVDAIAAVPVEMYEGRADQHCQSEGQPSCPVDDVVIQSIRRMTTGQVADTNDTTDSITAGTDMPRIACPSAPAAHTPQDIVLEGDLQAGLITPHTWNVCSTDERMLLWAHNSLGQAVDAPLSATIDGTAPANGWELTFEEETLHMEADGSKAGSKFTDWAWTVMHLTVPDEASGEHQLQLMVGETLVDATLHVASDLAPTMDRGATTTVTFDGDFTDSGEGFWEGTIPGITVGSGGLVTGVDLGLLGLGYQETASLIVPPALAYGYDNPDGSGYEKFNGEWLTFKVTVDEF